MFFSPRSAATHVDLRVDEELDSAVGRREEGSLVRSSRLFFCWILSKTLAVRLEEVLPFVRPPLSLFPTDIPDIQRLMGRERGWAKSYEGRNGDKVEVDEVDGESSCC